MTVMIYPYKAGSNSAAELARALGVRRISHQNSRFRGREDKTIINWGGSRLPDEVNLCRVINPQEAARKASDKLAFFTHAECRVPDWTTDPDVAENWWEEGSIVVERHVLNGNSGQGIRLASQETGEGVDDDAPLYTKYVPKRHEYRIHVFQGRIISVQRKARSHEVPDEQVNWKIRNHTNGFIFARNEEALGEIPADVLEQAVLSVNSIGLDFGASDVIFNERSGQAYVLEVNTAPGLTGTTLTDYAEAFRSLLNL